MKNDNRLLAMIDLDKPIIVAPMVGVSTPALTAAVSSSGALGSFGAGASTAAETQALIKATRTLTTGPFNVNVFCHQPAKSDPAREAKWIEFIEPILKEFGAERPAALRLPYKSFLEDEDTLDMLIDERPAVVSFHFGLPPKAWVERLRQASIITLATATSLKEAAAAQATGIDAVVAQGIEAGGHRGTFDQQRDASLGTLVLTRLLASRLQIPVIAAGGIMDGQGIAAALALGAEAVQMGTAFVLCPESAAKPSYRKNLAGEAALNTAITAVISGRPARGLVHRFHREIDVANAPPLPDYPIAYDAGKLLVAAASKSEGGFEVQWAGQGAPLARSLAAARLIEVLMEELATGRSFGA
jgi:nitronate monooxygenase